MVLTALGTACGTAGTITAVSESESSPATTARPTTTSAKQTATTTADDPDTDETTDTTDDSDTTETTGDESTETTESTDSTEAETTPIKACTLLTRADAEEAFGEPAEAGTQSSDECWWNTEHDLKVMNLIVRDSEDLDDWRAGHDNEYWEPYDLGDEAYRGKVLDSIVFRIGTVTYDLNVVFAGPDMDRVVDVLAEHIRERI